MLHLKRAGRSNDFVQRPAGAVAFRAYYTAHTHRKLVGFVTPGLTGRQAVRWCSAVQRIVPLAASLQQPRERNGVPLFYFLRSCHSVCHIDRFSAVGLNPCPGRQVVEEA